MLKTMQDTFHRGQQNIPALAAMYDRWAPVYHDECTTGFIRYEAPQVVCNAIIDAIPNTSDVARILDAGAGSGYSLSLLKPHFQNAHRTAIDLSPKMLERCRKEQLADTFIEANLDGKKWLVEDAKSDLIISVGVAGLIADMPTFMSEAARNLKTGGVLAMTFLRRNLGHSMSIDASVVHEYPRHHFEIDTIAELAGLDKMGDHEDFHAFTNMSNTQVFGLYLGRKL